MDQIYLWTAALLIITVWNLILTIILFRVRKHYHALTDGITQKDLTTTLNQILKCQEHHKKDIDQLSGRLDKEIERDKSDFKKIGFKRYNPFTDTGGDQSFVLCLLDENDCGFVISSLHSRENTRIYAKRIIGGQAPDQVLSREEQEVISSAQK